MKTEPVYSQLNSQTSKPLAVQKLELFSQAPHLYDVIYFDFGKYMQEIDFILEYSQLQPGASQILDVACGTGCHLLLLFGRGYNVMGLDLSRAMLHEAKRKCPQVPLLQRDMRTFTLEKTFDLIMCMYGAIHYLESEEQIKLAIKNFLHHLKPGGKVVIDTRCTKNLPESSWIDIRSSGTVMGRWIKQAGRESSDLYVVSYLSSDHRIYLTEVHNLFCQNPFLIKEIMKKVGFVETNIFENYDMSRHFSSETNSPFAAVVVGEKPESEKY